MFMFTKVLKAALEDLGLPEIKLGDIKISKKENGYQLKFSGEGRTKIIDSNDIKFDDFMEVVNELAQSPDECCFKLDLNERSLEAMMNNKIRFCISTYHGSDLVDLDFEAFRGVSCATVKPNTIELNLNGARVTIPARGDSEIRIYI